ncbi:hypothetical protein ACFV8Z_55790 [Streptomyces sp. NPDC059837]|uniref:hypothetical protein n=1 Tax=Streptomyces sp. NPDC059837 TaxID=3346968 RepID=UPI0036490698
MTEIVYDDLPDGLLTTLTYGLSLAEHPDWQHGSPELCLSVNSTNVIWAHAVGFLAEQLRGTCPFSYGSTINFGERDRARVGDDGVLRLRADGPRQR